MASLRRRPGRGAACADGVSGWQAPYDIYSYCNTYDSMSSDEDAEEEGVHEGVILEEQQQRRAGGAEVGKLLG